MMRIDPHMDFLREEERRQKWLDSRPVCDCCGEPIQEDYYFFIGDDERICEDCMIGNYRVPID